MKSFFKEWIVPVFLALIIVIFLNTFIFILVTVPSGSMENTITPGDKLYVNKLFNTNDTKRGDILVFLSNDKSEKIKLVKRVIGLPGDQVQVVGDGTIYVNGKKLEEDYVTQVQEEPKYFEVPENCYLFFGDNRPISIDARSWNNPYAAKDKVIGKVMFRFFPFNRIGKVL